jgi:small GTP-binding protein
VDTPFVRNGKKYTIIDTAGIRKKRSVEDDVEYYSVLRAFDAVRRADVCVLVVDATQGLTEQDTKIIGFVHEEGKPSVIVMNKWDLVEKDTNTINKFEAKLQEDLKFMSYFKSVYISAKTGQRAEKVLDMVDTVYANASRRVTIGELNDLIMDAVRVSEPPSYNGRRIRFYSSSTTKSSCTSRMSVTSKILSAMPMIFRERRSNWYYIKNRERMNERNRLFTIMVLVYFDGGRVLPHREREFFYARISAKAPRYSQRGER